MNPRAVYSQAFFDWQVERSSRSASVVVPLVLSLLPIKSVVDVGCGLGTWLAEFVANGVPDVWGVDGDYIDRLRLRIPADRFSDQDLTKPIHVPRTFDLAICLEVAEHLPEARAVGLVSDLTALAPSVLFSAAIPGQGGAHHVNEQYLPYWMGLFQHRGCEGVDPIRPRILGNDSVQWCYQQNTVMFVAKDSPLLARDFPKAHTIVHQRGYETYRAPTLGMLARAFPGALIRSVRYRLGRLAQGGATYASRQE